MKQFLENVNRRMDDFFFDLTYIICAFILGYAVVYAYFGVKELSISLFIVLGIILPSSWLLKKLDRLNELKLIVIALSNLTIFLNHLFIGASINAEFYYVPALILPFVLYPTHNKNWILVGSSFPLIFWSSEFYDLSILPFTSQTPARLPIDLFQKLNVMGSFIITMMIMTRYQIYLFSFKYAAEREIEQTKLVEQNLEEAQRIARVGNWQLDLRTQNLFWSKEQYRIFALEGVPPQMLFQACRERFHHEDIAIFEMVIQNCIQKKEPFEIEHRIIVDGEIRHMLARGEPVFNSSGEVVGLFGTGQDITERKKTEQLVAEQQVMLISTSKLASLGEMAGGIAHEINNPLSIIKSKSDYVLKFLKNDPKSDTKLVSDVELISSTSDRIAKIVKGLRALSRNSESDPQQIVNLKTIIDDVLALSRQKLDELHIEIKTNISPTVFIRCRPAEIGQVLINLINNSADAIEKLNAKWIEIETLEDDKNITTVIRDSGRGIAKDVAAKMMNPFYTTKDVGRGTGLGLSISRGITERHDGRLFYKPNTPHTEFHIVLPKAPIP